MKLAAMAIGAKSKRVMKQYHHGRYSFKSWKKVTLIKVVARTKIIIAMNIIPHLIGRQPKQDASPTLSWEHAHMQQQHGLKVYTSLPESSVSELEPFLDGVLLVFLSSLVSTTGAGATTSFYSSVFSTTGFSP